LHSTQGYRFEVLDMDGKRVDKLLVAPISRPKATDESAEAGA
jgi:CBS domain containing-hemolysin-like protein